MRNPLTAAVGWLIANPLASHAVVASLETAALALIIGAGLAHFAIQTIPAWVIVLGLPALIVSTFYYGREAGQHEHDLKHAGTAPFLAFAGAEFGFLWGLDNLLQWLVAAGASAAMAAALKLAGL